VAREESRVISLGLFSERAKMRLKLARRVAVTAAVVASVSFFFVHVSRLRSQTTHSIDTLECATVRRTDVNVAILTSGEIQCSSALRVRCELESMGGGQAGSSSTILYLIPEGTQVKAGDLLCELDSSTYQDMAQQQEIKVAQARAEKVQAELDVQIAQIAALEFKEGLNSQTEKGYLGQIALVQSDLQRAKDRVAWSLRMLDKGYVSAAQVATEKTTKQRSQLSSELSAMTLENHRRFVLPKTLRSFESQIVGAQSALDYQTMRLMREEERLALYQKQVERCSIRAPHDGMAVYANEPGKSPKIFEEAPVRQRQELFYLPDLSDLEVGLYLHETVVSRVEVGMRARVIVEAHPDVPMEGHVSAVFRLPMRDKTKDSSNEVKIYQGRLELDTIPTGLLPGMTAQVVLSTDQRRDALLIPAEAVTIEQGAEVCYVVRGDHLERQPVEVNAATQDQLEVTDGLEEGERVVLNPIQQGVVGTAQAAE
jgi:HlyD family secretion protein